MYGIISYREYMEQWVKDWVKKQRESGEKGIEIKKQANSYYVYRSTTYWDKKAKKGRKKSTYIGKLSRDGLSGTNQKEIIATSFWNFAMPLIRYSTRDLITPSTNSKCSLVEVYPP